MTFFHLWSSMRLQGHERKQQQEQQQQSPKATTTTKNKKTGESVLFNEGKLPLAGTYRILNCRSHLFLESCDMLSSAELLIFP